MIDGAVSTVLFSLGDKSSAINVIRLKTAELERPATAVLAAIERILNKLDSTPEARLLPSFTATGAVVSAETFG
jgi:hypothetical protein